MSRKYNPYVSLVALLLLALILVLTCTGCRKEAANATRFTQEEIYHDWVSGNRARIITDTETGRQYLLYANHNSSGMVELED